ncbi:hypothetical protein ACT3HK_11820 [Thermolongibacillus altinsuensis]
MTMANAMKMTTTGRKQKFVGGVVVWAFGMRKRKILNKWRNWNGKEINWKRKI